MDDNNTNLTQNITEWTQSAIKAGWLTETALSQLQQLEDSLPRPLVGGKERPLTVGFFGGTGVGKSSLLNRLAGENIARTGVQRPTSREITLYLHESVQLNQLDQELPLENHRISRHQNTSQKSILWVDMPDMDSTAQENHAYVEEWLPHIDVVIYVVSPERYRDNRGWSYLQQFGHQHAWLFIMNQWDRGDPAQLDDFSGQLTEAGFSDPLILCTSCDKKGTQDDFEQLQAIIKDLANARIIEQLDIRGQKERLEKLAILLEQWQRAMGNKEDQGYFRGFWHKLWHQTERDLLAGLEWPARLLARYHIARYQVVSTEEESESKSNAPRHKPPLWEEWANNLLQDTQQRLLLEMSARDLAVQSVKPSLNALCDKVEYELTISAEKDLRKALSLPGSKITRMVHTVSQNLTLILPVITGLWAGYQILTGYYLSSVSDKPYLGTDFAVHSILLIALSWALPWYISQKLKPSLEDAATSAIIEGIRHFMDEFEDRIMKILEQAFEQKKQLSKKLQQLIQQCHEQEPDIQISNPTLVRMLPTRRKVSA